MISFNIYQCLFQRYSILQPSNYKSSGMGSKLSGGMGMSRVGTRLVGGVMSGHRNSIDRSGKIETFYYGHF